MVADRALHCRWMEACSYLWMLGLVVPGMQHIARLGCAIRTTKACFALSLYSDAINGPCMLGYGSVLDRNS